MAELLFEKKIVGMSTRVTASLGEDGITVSGETVDEKPILQAQDARWSVLIAAPPAQGEAMLTALKARCGGRSASFDDIHQYVIEQGGSWRRLAYEDAEGSEAAEAYASSDIPAPGDAVYIPSELHVSRGVDDYSGGRTSVTKVVVGRPHDRFVWVHVAFEDAGEYRWDVLKSRQAELAERFGAQAPKPSPDYRPEFNRFDD